MKTSRPFFIFYILVGYIFIQFAWWGYHLIELNEEIYELRIALAEAQITESSYQDLADKLNGRRAMVFGEGTVFLILLIIGAYITRRSFLKEVELSNQQKNFLMSVSHELKSPLSAIKLNMQTLKKHDLDTAKSEALLSASLKDADRLVGLVDNIMIATDLESGDFPLKKEKLNFSNLVSTSVSHISARNSAKIEMNIEQDLFVDGDEQAMISICSNLVENALKYSETDSSVFVALGKQDGKVCLAVTDQGMGIAADDKQRIFEKFFRGGDEATREAKGTGLGLFIAQHLTEKQNGSISVRSNDPKGSIFEVRFDRATL